MHNAPPVVYPVGRFVMGHVAWLGASLLSAMGLLAWQRWSQPSWTVVLWAGMFWTFCVSGAALWLPRQALSGGRLLWTGEGWFWQSDDDADGDGMQALWLTVGWDAGPALLLWARPMGNGAAAAPAADGRLLSVWVQRSAMPSKWHGFRCAVYSRPKIPQSADALWRERL